MASPNPSSIARAAVAWTLLSLLFVLSVPLLLGATPWVLLAVFALGALVAVGLRWLLGRLRPARGGSPVRSALAGGMLATVLVALPLYWLVLQPALRPLTVPRVTLGDGQRQVVFQGMTHIGSAPFYRSVAFDLMRAREAGFVVLYEGVMPGTPEAADWFRQVLGGGGDLNANYTALAEACGLHFQNEYLGFVATDALRNPAQTINADVSETQMMDEWNRLLAGDPALATQLRQDHPSGQAGGSGMQQLMSLVTGLGDRSHALVAASCRGFFTLALQLPEHPDVLNAVVLDFRNRQLAERIQALAGRDLYIIYGSGHLPGLLQALQAQNPAWRVEAVTWSVAIEAPEDAHGTLALGVPATAPVAPAPPGG